MAPGQGTPGAVEQAPHNGSAVAACSLRPRRRAGTGRPAGCGGSPWYVPPAPASMAPTSAPRHHPGWRPGSALMVSRRRARSWPDARATSRPPTGLMRTGPRARPTRCHRDQCRHPEQDRSRPQGARGRLGVPGSLARDGPARGLSRLVPACSLGNAADHSPGAALGDRGLNRAQQVGDPGTPAGGDVVVEPDDLVILPAASRSQAQPSDPSSAVAASLMAALGVGDVIQVGAGLDDVLGGQLRIPAGLGRAGRLVRDALHAEQAPAGWTDERLDEVTE